MDYLVDILTVGSCPLLAFSDVLFEQTYIKLEQHFRTTSQVTWSDVTVVYCTASNLANLSNNSILKFDQQANVDHLQYGLRKQLLFVHHFPSNVLCVFGALSFAQYMYLQDEQGCIYIANLHRLLPREPLCGSNKDADEITPYYNFTRQLNLRSCRELLFRGNDSSYKFRKYDSLRNVPGAHAAFPLALYSAAASPLFEHRFVQRELEMLLARLQCYSAEEDRLAFAKRWFDNAFSIGINYNGAVAHAEATLVPELRESSEAMFETSERLYRQLRRFHTTHYPTTPTPSYFFFVDVATAPAFMATNCARCGRTGCVRPPIEKGKLFLTHLELDLYLPQLWRHCYEEIVFDMQESLGACYLGTYWARPERDRNYLAEEAPKFSQDANAAREALSVALDEVLIPTFHEANDTWSWYFNWDFDSVAKSENTGSGPSEALPTSRSALVAYAREYWPPCMQALVEQCTGKRHLLHEERIKMAALLRSFGYSLAQAEQLWWNLFRTTNANAQYFHQETFRDGEYGQVIVNDYRTNKVQNVGVSCEALVRKQLCPLVAMGDIEELVPLARQRCTESLQAHRAAKGQQPLKYPVYSPRNYFNTQTKYK